MNRAATKFVGDRMDFQARGLPKFSNKHRCRPVVF